MLKWTFTSFIRIKSVKISKVCKLFQFPKNALILTDKQNMCDIYMYYESKSAEDSYRQNFLSFYLLYLFKSNGLKKKTFSFQIYLFIFGCAGFSLLCARFLQFQRAKATLAQCRRFSLQRLLLWSTCSKRLGFRSCGAQAQLLHGMWDPPRPGIKPMSPALVGRFSTTGLQEKHIKHFFFFLIQLIH